MADGGHYAQLEESQRTAVKTALVGWLQLDSNIAAESFVKNKFSVAIVRSPGLYHSLRTRLPLSQLASTRIRTSSRTARLHTHKNQGCSQQADGVGVQGLLHRRLAELLP